MLLGLSWKESLSNSITECYWYILVVVLAYRDLTILVMTGKVCSEVSWQRILARGDKIRSDSMLSITSVYIDISIIENILHLEFIKISQVKDF